MYEFTEEEIKRYKNKIGKELLKVDISIPRIGFEEQKNFLIYRAKNYFNDNDFVMCQKLIDELKRLVIER